MHPDWEPWRILSLAGPSLFYASTPTEIDRAVVRLAELLRTGCRGFLRGEHELFAQLSRNTERDTRDSKLCWEIEPLRSDAERAFRQREYAEAVALYEELAVKLAELGEGLRRVDRARLTFARNRI